MGSERIGSRAGRLWRDVLLAIALAGVMLAVAAGFFVRRGPTLVAVAIAGLVWLWSRAPLIPEEAVIRAKLRHRILGLDGCRWLERVAEDETGALYRSRVRWSWWEEPLQVVEVCNYTPEPDGEFRRYVLRVPPTITTARAAVAWTFGFEEDLYGPEDES